MDNHYKYEEAKKRVKKKKGFYAHLASYLIINGIFFFIVFLNGGGFAWLYPASFWGIGLAMHYLSIFGFPGSGGVGGWSAPPVLARAMSRVGKLASIVTTRFNFAGAEGATVWGQITRLENQQGPIPAILYIHGGPQGSFNDGWSSRWNPRVLASQGYAVISVDFHGSTGYGQAFTDAINRDWGGKPLKDLQLGLDAALKLDRQIDGSRACAMGASYGGYMVNWIAGNWPDRFQCLVQHDGLFDMRSFYYSTEELWFPRWDFGGSYAEASETYEKWNPVNHVDKWQTPMLVIAGEKDFRVPYTQGLQSFTALQERGIPPMAWSPLAGGALVSGDGNGGLRGALMQVAQDSGTDIGAVAVAWLLAHPARILPVLGTNNLDRIARIGDAAKVKMDRETWYALYTEALGHEVP